MSREKRSEVEEWVLQGYDWGMFIRKNKNRSGTVSVQIVKKDAGRYRVVKTLGSSGDPDEIMRLELEAKHHIERPEGQGRLFAVETKESHAVKTFIHSLRNAQVRTVGPELIFGTLFDRMGFGIIDEEIFRHITIARLAFPRSKLKTADYLRRFSGKKIEVSQIYRFLDTLNKEHKEKVERIAYEHTQKTLGTISVVFYDMTTLYFDAEDEDDLRKIGFSKDGKFQNPQIMVGLLVGAGGYPIGYDIFEGNTFEGKTLLPVLEKIERRYKLGKPIVVADAAMLSHNNIAELTSHGYLFILGARIKNEKEALQKQILEQGVGVKDGDTFELAKADGTRLIISHSDKRARKDAYNREKGLKKLRAKVASGKLGKAQITNRGYNKFLTLSGEVTVAVNEEKVKEDARWDGLKGYVTSTALAATEVIEHYGHLWQIEKAFRISKTDLRIRPIFHYKRRRIEAHLCISFVAYAIWKELERLLKYQSINMSPRRAGELTQNMYELVYQAHDDVTTQSVLLHMDEEQQLLYNAISKT